MGFYRGVTRVLDYWAIGTALSCSVLGLGVVYIVAEYCTQSHLAAEDYHQSCDGLRLTRRFKKYTYWLRLLLGLGDWIVLLFWNVTRKATNRQPRAFNKTLVWNWKVKSRSADGRPAAQAPNDQSRRRSSTPSPSPTLTVQIPSATIQWDPTHSSPLLPSTDV